MATVYLLFKDFGFDSESSPRPIGVFDSLEAARARKALLEYHVRKMCELHKLMGTGGCSSVSAYSLASCVLNKVDGVEWIDDCRAAEEEAVLSKSEYIQERAQIDTEFEQKLASARAEKEKRDKAKQERIAREQKEEEKQVREFMADPGVFEERYLTWLRPKYELAIKVALTTLDREILQFAARLREQMTYAS